MFVCTGAGVRVDVITYEYVVFFFALSLGPRLIKKIITYPFEYTY